MEFKKIRNHYINLNNVNYIKKSCYKSLDIILLTIVMNNEIIEFEFQTVDERSEFIIKNFKII